MSSKDTCFLCRLLYLDTGSPSYSEYTPGTNFAMWCEKDHWRFDQGDDDPAQWHRKITSSRECTDFAPRETA